MARMTIVRERGQPSAGQRSSFRAVLFGLTEGMRPEDAKAWRAFWIRIFTAEPGELLDITYKFPRNPRFHRKFFAMLGVGFDAWEPAESRVKLRRRGVEIQKNFEAFRRDVTILAGFYTPRYTIDGRTELEADSISFANMDDVEFERVYSAVVDVLLQKVLTHYTKADLNNVVDRLLDFT